MASRTAEYYRKNPAARKRRLKQQSRYQKTEVSKRVQLNRINRKVGKKGDGKDVSHCEGGGTRLEKASNNRARNRGKLKCKRK